MQDKRTFMAEGPKCNAALRVGAAVRVGDSGGGDDREKAAHQKPGHTQRQEQVGRTISLISDTGRLQTLPLISRRLRIS